jgi:hypothetical protein
MSNKKQNNSNISKSIIQVNDAEYYAALTEIKEIKEGRLGIRQTNADAMRDALDRELGYWRAIKNKEL